MQSAIGKHYSDFWHFRGLYIVLRGSRSSKKSTNIAIRYIYLLMKYPDANLLVVRLVFDTLRDSCYAQL